MALTDDFMPMCHNGHSFRKLWTMHCINLHRH